MSTVRFQYDPGAVGIRDGVLSEGVVLSFQVNCSRFMAIQGHFREKSRSI